MRGQRNTAQSKLLAPAASGIQHLVHHPCLLPHWFAESNTTTNKYAKRTHLIAALLAELVLRLESPLLCPLVADGLLGLGKVQRRREGAHGRSNSYVVT